MAPIRVNAVSPGVIDTHWWHGMPEDQRRAYFDAVAAVTPTRRVGRPEDVADAALRVVAGGQSQNAGQKSNP